MTERGFYHPSRGYWQTISEPDAETLTGYPEGTIQVPIKPGADYDWRDGEWVHVEPQHDIEAERAGMSCSRFQARAALMQAGLLDQAEAIIAQADALTRLAWTEAVEFRRTSPTIAAMGAALGMTDEQLDALFETAAGIEA